MLGVKDGLLLGCNDGITEGASLGFELGNSLGWDKGIPDVEELNKCWTLREVLIEG